MARVLRGFAPEECYSNIIIPLLEIKDFGPPAAYGEDKGLKIN